jgi:hypothetical protein
MTGSPPASPAERAARLARIGAKLDRLHGRNCPRCLSWLHAEAAALLEAPQARRFHLTHAWVFALVAGDWARAAELEARLAAAGGL